jgi:hypothetical protein
MENKKDVFSVISNMEHAVIRFERVSNMILMLDEFLEGEVGALSLDDGWAKHFQARFDVARSQLEAIEQLIGDAVANMRVHVKEGYDIARTIKSSQKEGRV